MSDHVHVLCDTKSAFVLTGYVLPILYAVSLIILSPLLYVYVVAYIKQELKTARKLFYVGLAFFATILLYVVGGVVTFAVVCHAETIGTLFYLALYLLYSIQGVMLLVTMFMRFLSIFKDSVFAVSKRTIYAYSALAFFTILITIIYLALLFVPRTDDIRLLLVAGFFIVYLFLLIWTDYLFITRLLKVHQSSKDSVPNDDSLKYVASKNATLCFVSTSTIIFTAIANMMRNRSFSAYTNFTLILACQLDMITNFLSIFLTYKYFDASYLRFCGCVHRCIVWCARARGRNGKRADEVMMTAEIPSRSISDNEIPSAIKR